MMMKARKGVKQWLVIMVCSAAIAAHGSSSLFSYQLAVVMAVVSLAATVTVAVADVMTTAVAKKQENRLCRITAAAVFD